MNSHDDAWKAKEDEAQLGVLRSRSVVLALAVAEGVCAVMHRRRQEL
jgi:hypothetical protein